MNTIPEFRPNEVFASLPNLIVAYDDRVRWAESLASGGSLTNEMGRGRARSDSTSIVYERRATLKIMISKVAMHLSNELRGNIFLQIDRLYDLDSYKENKDQPIYEPSFESYLRFLINLRFLTNIDEPKPPVLGMSIEGHVLAAWKAGSNKTFLEFLSNDRLRMSLVDGSDPEAPNIVSSSGGVEVVLKCLKGFDAMDLIYE